MRTWILFTVALALLGLCLIFIAIVFYLPQLFSFSEDFPYKTQTLFIGISSFTTLFLALVAFISIIQNKRIREQDRELESKRRRLADIQQWVDDVQRIKALALGPPGIESEIRQRVREVNRIVAFTRSARIEASKIDAEQLSEVRLAEKIGSISSILRTTDLLSLGNENTQAQLDEVINEVLQAIFDIKQQLMI